MKAMRLHRLAPLRENPNPLTADQLDVPEPGADEVLIRVLACGVCHTELDEIEGRTPPPRLPVVPGHQVVGTVSAMGSDVAEHSVGDRVGVAWIYSACGECEFCTSGRENLCDAFCATGRDADGGYAEYMKVPGAYAHPLPSALPDVEVAPLLCAGAIGYRSLQLSGLRDGRRLGLTGFGASGHLVLQLARHLLPATDVFVFARDAGQREFARQLGAVWAGPADARPPALLHAIIDTTPVWGPIVEALDCLAPGGRLVVNAIRKESGDQQRLLDLDYARHLWLEKEIRTVANITRRDVREFLQIAADAAIAPAVQEYPLEDANAALRDLRSGGGHGSRVLRIS